MAVWVGDSSVAPRPRQRDTREVVAIKCVNKRSLNRASVENLLTEIEILKTIRHPNIVELKDFQVGWGLPGGASEPELLWLGSFPASQGCIPGAWCQQLGKLVWVTLCVWDWLGWHWRCLVAWQWDSDHIYLIMEFCAGGDLSRFIRMRRMLPEKVARVFLQQLGEEHPAWLPLWLWWGPFPGVLGCRAVPSRAHPPTQPVP